MTQETCKHVVKTPEGSDKIPVYPFCSLSGLKLEPNGNGGFICPPKCAELQRVLLNGQEVRKGKVIA